jgi:hypothetical protein
MLHLSRHGTPLSGRNWPINSITLSGNSTFIVDSGPVVVNVAGQINAAGQITSSTINVVDFTGGTVTNSTGIPSNLQFVYAGSNPMDLSGGSGTDTVVYAPNSAVTASGGSDLYGAVVANTLNDSGGTSIHYDQALQTSALKVGQYRPVGGFSWSKF